MVRQWPPHSAQRLLLCGDKEEERTVTRILHHWQEAPHEGPAAPTIRLALATLLRRRCHDKATIPPLLLILAAKACPATEGENDRKAALAPSQPQGAKATAGFGVGGGAFGEVALGGGGGGGYVVWRRMVRWRTWRMVVVVIVVHRAGHEAQ